MDMKLCSRCKNEKPKSEFDKDSSKKDQLRCCCRSCGNELNSKWVKNKKSQINKYIRERRANNQTVRLANNLRNRLRSASLRQLTNKNSKTEDLLGI